MKRKRFFVICYLLLIFRKIKIEIIRDLMDELVIYIREAVDRKQENMRRRRRRDALRLQLVKVLEKIAENRTFAIRYAFNSPNYYQIIIQNDQKPNFYLEFSCFFFVFFLFDFHINTKLFVIQFLCY